LQIYQCRAKLIIRKISSIRWSAFPINYLIYQKKGCGGGVFMRTTYSYESILRAVGRVLDHSGVKSISLRELDNGLVIEGYNQDGQTQVCLTYDLDDLVTFIDRTEDLVDDFFAAASAKPLTLAEFLARQEVTSVR
jgi:hypothetical protein